MLCNFSENFKLQLLSCAWAIYEHYGELVQAALLTLTQISVEDTPDVEMFSSVVLSKSHHNVIKHNRKDIR
jgi:hypothetical protein